MFTLLVHMWQRWHLHERHTDLFQTPNFAGTVWFPGLVWSPISTSLGWIGAKDYEPTSVSELINAQRMVKIFQKNTPKSCGKPSWKSWRCYQTDVNVSALTLLFKTSIAFFCSSFFNPPPKCLSDKISNFKTTNQINPTVQQSHFSVNIDVAHTFNNSIKVLLISQFLISRLVVITTVFLNFQVNTRMRVSSKV